jgi:hypothetical protein
MLNLSSHCECIGEWLPLNFTCPVCRAVAGRFHENFPSPGTLTNTGPDDTTPPHLTSDYHPLRREDRPACLFDSPPSR